MGTLIVRCDTPQHLASIKRAVMNHEFVTGFVQFDGLKKLATITHTDGPQHKNDVRNFLYALDPVYGVIDGDNQMNTMAQETVGLTLTRDARTQPDGITQLFHYRDDRKPAIMPWTQRPRADAYTRETGRMGSNIIVSVHDSGVDATNVTEFGTRVTEIYNGPGDGPGTHGTGVASIIAGNTKGFMPDAQILSSKCFSAANAGGIGDGIGSLDALVTWVQANVTTEHVIANCSFGSTSEFANDYATITDDVHDEGIALFAASGNFGWNLNTGLNFWPAEGLQYGACGAVNLNGEHLNFSNYGSMVKLHGLGWKVPCADVGDGNETHLTGTSFGCPSVAGAYGTWAASKEAPRSASEVLALMSDYVDYCQQGGINVRPNESPSLATKACVAKADNRTM